MAGRFYKKLGEYSREMVLDFDKETIHNLRVEYKKLRAFFRLVNESTAKPLLQIPKKLKAVYSLAGALRDQQLQEIRVKETAQHRLSRLPGNYFLPGRQITEIKSGLRELLAANPLKKCKRKTGEAHLLGFTLDSFPEYFQHKCSAARGILLSGVLTDERIHAVRKILKDLVYNLEIYRLEDRLPAGTWKEKVADYFNPLLEDMGDYQDQCTAIALIESFWLHHLHTKHRDFAAFIKEEWEKEKTSIKARLVTKLKADQVIATGMLEDIPLTINIVL